MLLALRLILQFTGHLSIRSAILLPWREALLALAALLLAGCAMRPPALPSQNNLICAERVALQALLSEFQDSPHPLKWPAAHRGNADRSARSAPAENSLAAFANAWKMGVPIVEFDVRSSRDNELFIFHDRTVPLPHDAVRRPTVRRAVRELFARELKAVRLSDSVHSKIPTLREVGELLKDQPVLLLPEPKEHELDFLRSFLKILSASGIAPQSIVQCLSLEVLSAVRLLAPQQMVLARVRSPADLDLVLPYHPNIVQLDEDYASPAILERIHSAHARVLIKTLDRLDDSSSHRAALLTRGVDIVLTDYAASLRWEVCAGYPTLDS